MHLNFHGTIVALIIAGVAAVPVCASPASAEERPSSKVTQKREQLSSDKVRKAKKERKAELARKAKKARYLEQKRKAELARKEKARKAKARFEVMGIVKAVDDDSLTLTVNHANHKALQGQDLRVTLGVGTKVLVDDDPELTLADAIVGAVVKVQGYRAATAAGMTYKANHVHVTNPQDTIDEDTNSEIEDSDTDPESDTDTDADTEVAPDSDIES